MKRRSSALVVALLCAQAILNSRAEGEFTPLGSFNDSGLEWRASVGCHRYGPGCWIPGFAGTDASPLAHDGGIVIGSYDGHLYHVAADGTQIWNATLGNSIGYSAVGEGTPALVTPNPDKPTLKCFVVATLDSVKCLSADAATVVWSWTPAGGGQVASCGGVDAARGLVFVGTLHRKLYAVRTQDGTTAWTYDAGGRSGPLTDRALSERTLCARGQGARRRLGAIAVL
jgi:outer membrane protein assembly factor BamB